MLVLKILLVLNLNVVFGENCSSATSCSDCLSLDDACYWCAALATEKTISGCLRFNLDNIAELLCPAKWVHSKNMCSAYGNSNNIDLMKTALLSGMSYRDKLSEIANKYFNGDNYVTHSLEKDTSNPLLLQRAESKGLELKNLLHKLLILKLYRKIKNKDTAGLTEEERSLLYKLSDKSKLLTHPATIAVTTTTTTTTMPKSAMNSDEISELLRILRKEAERRLRGETIIHSSHPTAEQQLEQERVDSKYVDPIYRMNNEHNSVNVKTTVEQLLKEEKATLFPMKLVSKPKARKVLLPTTQLNTKYPVNPTVKTSVIAEHNHVENVDVKYEEKTEETLQELMKMKIVNKYKNTSTKSPIISTLRGSTNPKPSTSSRNELQYCKLFEENDLCNSDHNCTWCNTLDVCIQRNKDNYKKCVKHVKQMVDDEYELDRCFEAKHCKQCVQDDKCYWCDVSQRCHTYPFFGYVPNSCGGDWYVKQCDVQLAVIIVVLPLIIILLGMVTFYFCLKYCHYRQKVLRVPLFEKPGIFDYRKDKKVYFVNPEDESSDDELAKEKMRKKYRIPLEKEPLIDPNT